MRLMYGNYDDALKEIRDKVIKLEADLAAHQNAFEKHEKRDNERFKELGDKVERFTSDNYDQHTSIRAILVKLQLKMAWVFGAGFALITIVQVAIHLYTQTAMP